jgi:hypothetical protein
MAPGMPGRGRRLLGLLGAGAGSAAMLAGLGPGALPAQAEDSTASCSYSPHDHTAAVETGPCSFSQRQGIEMVVFGARVFRFRSAEQGRSFERSSSSEGIRFNREGYFTLQVRWPMPPGWEHDNVFLGRWQGQSTAGRAVIDVLTVEPRRIRWGNTRNGICDSTYSVQTLPWGRDGRYPDQLVPPREPSNAVFGVVRLTLKPGPCPTGDAVIQLAMPLDGSLALEVVTYDADGRLTSQYGAFQKLPGR